MRQVIFLLSVVCCFSACSPGYIKQEPTYVEITRPARPSDRHIWRDHEWVYSRKTKVYVPRDGYWVAPNGNRHFVPGHWKSNRRGITGYLGTGINDCSRTSTNFE